MKKILNTIFAFLSIALALNTSCVSDELGVEKNDSLILNLAFGTLQTKVTEDSNSDGAFNEDKINQLDLFFYQGTILKWHISTSASELSYDDVAKQATIPVASDKRALFSDNVTTSYDVYVVANNKADLTSIAENGDNLETLKNLIFQTTGFVDKGGLEAQTDFLMDGKLTKVISLNDPVLGTVSLKRAAAKIRMRLTNVDVPGYTYDTSIPVIARLIHFTDKSVLLEGGTATATSSSELENTASRNIETTLSNVNEKTTAAPFYSYANDWSNDSSLETYIELFIPLKNNTTQITNTYRYKIAVTPKGLTGDDAKYMTNLYRNHLYDIDVIIKILGGLDEPPVDVSGNYTIRDWGTQEILIDIKGSHFLVVSETNIVMPNISTYQLTFNSSIPNVTLVSGSFKATYTYVNVNNGQYVTVNITDGSQFPSVVVQNGVASGTISIQSTIPLNFIPKDITFSITNTQLTETIKIQQLPPTYFSVEKGNRSNLREVLDEAHTNPYMYTITTLAPSGDIIWGFPPVDANGNTSNSAEVANMVSPKFMMASQMGATDVMGYNSGVTNCQNYWEETTKNGGAVTYSDWRLPTEAEIKYIDDLQHNSYNPQGVVMRGNYYWDAYNGNGAYLMKAPITSSGNSNSAHVRCIRDIKD